MARNEVKKLKAQGASKEEINKAKQALKDAKKTRKQHKKEDGRGFFRKVGKVIKKGTMLPVRGAFLALLNINFRGLAKRLHDNKEAFGKFDKKWRNVFGGQTSKLKIAVNKGSYKKAVFGQSKKGVSGLGIIGYKQFEQLAALGAEPVTMTAGAWAALASSALTAVVGVLKVCGVNVPKGIDEALAAGEDAAAILDDEMVSEDPDNYEDGSDNDEPIKGDGETDIESLLPSQEAYDNTPYDPPQNIEVDDSELVYNEVDEELEDVPDGGDGGNFATFTPPSANSNKATAPNPADSDDEDEEDEEDEPKQKATSKGKKLKKTNDDGFFTKNKTPIIIGGVALLAIATTLFLVNKNKTE